MIGEGSVLIVEDDNTFANSLKGLLQKEGFNALVTSKTVEAMNILELNKISVLVIDCLLPGESGIDFAEKVRKKFPSSEIPIILMSGVFTDQSFMSESLRVSEAKAFLKKPFKVGELIAHFPDNEVTSVQKKASESPRKALYQIFSKVTINDREKLKLLDALDEIHGFDLPFIFNLMVETKISGNLNIINLNGDVSGVTFSRGIIVGVDIVDKETYLGKLLIESGFILKDDLDKILKLRNQKRIGENLIQSNLLSPHAFDIVMSHQMNLRLSRIIANDSLRFNFVHENISISGPYIDSETFDLYLHDWVTGKISIDWIKTHFLQWDNCRIVKSPYFHQQKKILSLPIFASLPNFIELITDGRKLVQYSSEPNLNEEAFLKALHLLLCKGMVYFLDEEVFKLTLQEKMSLLRKLTRQFQNKNKWECLEIMANAVGVTDENISEVMNQFKNFLSKNQFDMLGGEAEPMWIYLNALVKDVEIFASKGDKAKLKSEIAKQEVQQKVQALSMYEEAKNLLHKSQFNQALEYITKAATIDPKLDKIRLYSAWAKIGICDTSPHKEKLLNEVEMDLAQVPPEEKYEALFNFVTGLFFKAKGQYQSALKNIEKAVSLDNSMLVAKRELGTVTNILAPKKDIFHNEIKNLVGGFFKKK